MIFQFCFHVRPVPTHPLSKFSHFFKTEKDRREAGGRETYNIPGRQTGAIMGLVGLLA